MITELTEEQMLEIYREERNRKAREWYHKNKEHRSAYMKEWNRQRRLRSKGVADADANA